MTDITIRDGLGAQVTIPGPNLNGQATMANSAPVVPPSDLADMEPAGAPITGVTLPNGGVGIKGWLSALLGGQTVGLGAAGDAPPALASNASGILGWARKIVDLLGGTLSTRGIYLTAASYAGASIDMRSYGTVTLTVNAAPTAAYTPQWSVDNATWLNATGVDLAFTTQTSIGTSYTGSLQFTGHGYFRLNGGTGGTFFISGAE